MFEQAALASRATNLVSARGSRCALFADNVPRNVSVLPNFRKLILGIAVCWEQTVALRATQQLLLSVRTSDTHSINDGLQGCLPTGLSWIRRQFVRLLADELKEQSSSEADLRREAKELFGMTL